MGAGKEWVLLVGSLDSSQAAAYHVANGLRDNGYSVYLCTSAEAKTRIKPDRFLSKDTDLAGFSGVVFLDDGGDEKSAVALAKKANAADMAVGGFSEEGCAVLAKAGLLKDEHVCDGLPEEFYKGVKKKIDAPSVCSGTIVTGAGDCIPGYVMLLLDALGGEIKKVVHSTSIQANDKVAMVVDAPREWARYWPLSRRMAAKGATLAIARWSDIDVDNDKVSGCVLLDGKSVRTAALPRIPRKVWVRETGGIKRQAMVSALEGRGCRNINSSEAIALTKSAGSILAGICGFDHKASPSVFAVMRRTASGWESTRKLPQVVVSCTEAACVAFQSGLSNPDGVGELGIRIVLNEDRPTVTSIDPFPGGSPTSATEAISPQEPNWRLIMERELAREGIWLQGSDKVAMRTLSGVKVLTRDEALHHLMTQAKEAIHKAMEAGREGGLCARRAERVARRARHRYRVMGELSKILDDGSTKLAAISPSTIEGPYANLDLPMDERLFPYNEKDKYLKDDYNDDESPSPALKNQERYNPEYNEDGFYFVWNEIRRDPYEWDKRFEDGVYPMRNVLQRK